MVRTRRLELPWDLTPTRPSTWRVYQFRHVRRSDLAGARTQDPLLKREMLYQLSYQVFEACKYSINYLYFKFNCYKFTTIEFLTKMIKSLILMGYMGCGKSALGPLISSQTSLPFVDLDKYIETVSYTHLTLPTSDLV